MSKVITDLTSISTPDLLDLLLLHDTSVGVDKKLTYENLRDAIVAAVTLPDREILIVDDVKSFNVDGGTFTSGADRTRDLNTEQYNTITDASLAANQITLPAGSYEAEWYATAFDVDNHWSWLYDITGSAIIVLGSSMFCQDTADANNSSLGGGAFTLSEESIIELRHRCSLTRADLGFGLQTGVSGFNSVYAHVRIEKLDI